VPNPVTAPPTADTPILIRQRPISTLVESTPSGVLFATFGHQSSRTIHKCSVSVSHLLPSLRSLVSLQQRV